MIPRETLAALRDKLGADTVEEHPPLDFDGAHPTATLRPRDEESLALVTGSLGSFGLQALVRGGGSRDALGNPPAGGDVVLATDGVAGVDEFDPSEGVCHARAGTRLADARVVVNARGWELPLDGPGLASTVGGALASAAIGPRAHGFGLPRDVVLGLEVALPSGERTKCGGRVVKNVTGYDLNKVYTGSFGTLGVIAGAWLRLRARPERRIVVEATLSNAAGACVQGLAAARRTSARAVALLAAGSPGPERGFRLLLELAGDAASVERDAAWAGAELEAHEVEVDGFDSVRTLQGILPGASGLRFRLPLLPVSLEPALTRLADRADELLVYPGLGLAYAGFVLPHDAGPSQADAVFREVARVAAPAGGGWVCESAPRWAKEGRDVWGDASPALPLFRSLKQRFDPGQVLNPGRFVGGI